MDYIVTNWTIENNLLSSYVPDCRFRVLTKFISKKRHLLSVTLLARVSRVTNDVSQKGILIELWSAIAKIILFFNLFSMVIYLYNKLFSIVFI